MTYEEAKKMERDILKNSIKRRLFKYDPIKYAKFKLPKEKISSVNIVEIWDIVTTIHKHEKGDIFERDDLFFKTIKRRL